MIYLKYEKYGQNNNFEFEIEIVPISMVMINSFM